MLSDEEKKNLKHIKERAEYVSKNVLGTNVFTTYDVYCVNMLIEIIEKQSKEIEELKEYIHNNPWIYKQLNENYMLRVELEQKERKAWIKGTNDADELCNKKWVEKIKALMEKEDKLFFETKDVRHANRYKAYKELIKEE